MNQANQQLILDPDRLSLVPASTLLEAAAHGYIGVDHRFLHAILDYPEKSIPDLVRFAAREHGDDAVPLERELIEIFRHLKAPEAIPFLIGLVRRDPLDVDDDLVETFVQFGAAAVDPLLRLLEEVEASGKDAGDVPFLLSQSRVRDPRILDALTRRLTVADSDAALLLDMYGDPAAIPALEAALERLPPGDIARGRITSYIQALSSEVQTMAEDDEPFDIWPAYPDQDAPPLDVLYDSDRLAMLEHGCAELRADVAGFYRGAPLSDEITARLLELARNDPDPKVRGACWEALGDVSNEPEVRRAMLDVLTDSNASMEEKCGAAIALAPQTDNNVVFQTIESLYAEPRSRAKALKAMANSFDRRFASYPPKHLEDPDPDIKRQAIWAVGYLNLTSESPRLEAFFDDDEFRSDALFAYALSMPGDTSRGRIRALLDKIDEAAGGFKPDEQELIEIALDQRLVLHGMKPVFSAGEDEEEPETETVVSKKVGRNDPCPCGSGKKYKKCCGA